MGTRSRKKLAKKRRRLIKKQECWTSTDEVGATSWPIAPPPLSIMRACWLPEDKFILVSDLKAEQIINAFGQKVTRITYLDGVVIKDVLP